MNGNITLEGVTEANLNAVLALDIAPEQKKYVPSPAGILARAWAHRNDNADVHVICLDCRTVGLILVYDLTDEPACYFLMEMMIDIRYQNRGIARKALSLLISELSRAPRFPMIELAVDRANAAAIHAYEKAGFRDSGYTDPQLPQYVNMIYVFDEHR